MSEQPKKRPWFEFHLSTLIVLMFVAGGLLGANLWPSMRVDLSVVVVSTVDAPARSWRRFEASQRRCYGWPMTVIEVYADAPGAPNQSATYQTPWEGFAAGGGPDLCAQAAIVPKIAGRLYPSAPTLGDGTAALPQYSYAGVNLLVALAILAVVAVWLESRIRHRERRRLQC